MFNFDFHSSIIAQSKKSEKIMILQELITKKICSETSANNIDTKTKNELLRTVIRTYKI